MWWRPAWFSLKGKVGIRSQRRGAVLPHPALSTNRPADPCTTATVSGQIGEVWRGAHQEGVGDRPLQVTVRALDGAVLVGDAGVVAGRRHPVMGAESLVATGQVGLGRRVQITEGRRQAVGPVLARGAAERPERVLQALGEGDEALAPENHMRVLEAGVSEPEVVKPVIQPHAGDRDAEIGHVGEVRQPDPAGLMGLPEDDLLLLAMDGAPRSDATLNRAPDARAELRMTPDDLLEDRDRPQ